MFDNYLNMRIYTIASILRTLINSSMNMWDTAKKLAYTKPKAAKSFMCKKWTLQQSTYKILSPVATLPSFRDIAPESSRICERVNRTCYFIYVISDF